MSQAVILQHVAHEGPGRLVPVLRDFGIPTEVRHLYRGDEVPADLDEVRVLVVLGGPMGVADIGSPKYPFLAKEVEIIKGLVQHDRPLLGICLGAQLMAHAAGAKVYPNTRPGATPQDPPLPGPEFGWGPVSFPFPGATEPMVMGVPEGAMMFHWHYDTFDLPKLPTPPASPGAPPPTPGSVLISSTRACRNQAFRFKDRLFGFQYHFELGRGDIEAMVAAGRDDLVKALGPEGPARVLEDTGRQYARYERLGNRILQNWVQFLRLY